MSFKITQLMRSDFLFKIKNPRLRLHKNKNLKHLDDALNVLLRLLVFLLLQPGQDDQPVTLDRNFVVLRKKEKKKLIKDVRPRKIFYRGRLCWHNFLFVSSISDQT